MTGGARDYRLVPPNLFSGIVVSPSPFTLNYYHTNWTDQRGMWDQSSCLFSEAWSEDKKRERGCVKNVWGA